MITQEQQAKLKKLIKQHTKAQINESWAGASDPAEAKALRANAEACEANLMLFIEQLTIKVPS